MLSKEVVRDLKVADELRDLVASPGWKEYERLLRIKIDEATVRALRPLDEQEPKDGISHVLVGEANKGAIIGLRLALSLPSMIVVGAEKFRADLAKRNEGSSK